MRDNIGGKFVMNFPTWIRRDRLNDFIVYYQTVDLEVSDEK